LANNSGVFAFMSASIAVFLVGLVVAFNFDKNDLSSWGFLPLLSNTYYEKFPYLISIDYYDVKNYKLGPRVFMRLFGSSWENEEWRELEDGVRQHWDKSKTRRCPANFTMKTWLHLGRINRMALKVESDYEPDPAPKSIFVNGITINLDRGPLEMHI